MVVKICLFFTFAIMLEGTIATRMAAAPAKLSSSDQAMLIQVAALYRYGQFASVRARLAPAIEKWSDEQRLAANRLLQQGGPRPNAGKLPNAHGNSLTVGELLSRSLLQIAVGGAPGKLGVKESWMVLNYLGSRHDEIIQRTAEPPTTDLPASFLQYELTLQQIMDDQMQLAEAMRALQLCDAAASLLRRNSRVKPTEQQKLWLTVDYDQRRTKLRQRLDAWRQRAVGLRIQRVWDAEMVIRLSGDTGERLLAALVLFQDASDLAGELASMEQGGDKSLASDAARLSLIVQQSRGLEPQLAAKAQLLDTAIAWWLRGRYGLGPVGGGLLKPPGNPRHPATHGFVMMPPLVPTPNSPLTKPRFPRRHHFVWGAKRREIEVVEGRGKAGATDVRHSRHLVNYEFRHLDILVGDPFADARIGPIGNGASQRAARAGSPYTGGGRGNHWTYHLNYLLEHNGKLVPHIDERVSAAERHAAVKKGQLKFSEVTTFEAWPYPHRPPPEDKFMVENFKFEDRTTYRPVEKHVSHGQVTSDTEDMYLWVGFVEYANALRRFDELLKGLTPDELAAVEEIVSADPRLAVSSNLSGEIPGEAKTVSRRGLRWILALARLEVGAVLAAYTQHPEPFAVMRPSTQELGAYRELLLDAMYAHLNMLPRNIRWDLAPKADSRDLLQLHRHVQLTRRLIAATWALAPAKERPQMKYLADNLTSTMMPLEQHLQYRLRTTTSYSVGDEQTDKVDVFGSRTTSPTNPSFRARARRDAADRIRDMRSE